MTQVERIKAEVESLQAKTSIGLNEYTAGYENGKAEVCGLLLNLINSMQKESECEDLELASERYACKFSNSKYGHDKIKKAYTAGANWQKEQDQKTIELAEDHAMLAGMERMKEEMLKDAKCVKVYDDWTYGKDADRVKQPAVKLRDQSLQIGSEVKLIIIKEEQV